MRNVVSLVSVTFCLGLCACGAADDSTSIDKAEGGVCVEVTPAPAANNTAVLAPGVAGGGS